ncbi:SufD family Fe-S cluster assembly protein [bacterium]|nr:SufD family Fe-S cluster assembly protein [bacterium]
MKPRLWSWLPVESKVKKKQTQLSTVSVSKQRAIVLTEKQQLPKNWEVVAGQQCQVVELFESGQELKRQTKVKVQAGASLSVVQIFSGGHDVTSDWEIDLQGDRASAQVQTAYLVHTQEHLQLTTTIIHHGRQSQSLIEAQGVMWPGAEKLWRATIDFRRGCQGSSGSEKEQVLYWQEGTIKQVSAPLVLCQEDEVTGTHSVSAGLIDESMVQYLKTRGLNEQIIKQMIVRERIQKIISVIDDEKIQEQVCQQLKTQL